MTNYSYDKEADAAYLKIGRKNAKLTKTDSFEIPNSIPFGDINIDFDETNKIIGFEFLNASKYLPEELLE